jgi:hypothetical protein
LASTPYNLSNLKSPLSSFDEGKHSGTAMKYVKEQMSKFNLGNLGFSPDTKRNLGLSQEF